LHNTFADGRLDQLARVVRTERSQAVVFGADGHDQFASAASLPAVGDWVLVRDGVVRDVLPRWSALTRNDPAGGVQVLAANIDLVIITAPGDRLSPARVERELALAWDSGGRPMVVLTKADLVPSATVDDLRARLGGVDVIPTSVLNGVGIAEVAEALRPDRTAVMLGPSGAGKSTLANALLGGEYLATGAVREGDRRGRHTTTSRQLMAIPGGGVLIDTPGLRSLGLPADSGGIAQTFSDIAQLAELCRFGDCRHDTEPGCAVVEALGSGSLDSERYESFQKLQREVAAQDRRSDPRVRKAQLSVWKAQIKSARTNDKRRPR
jgi:ribosome biogenesis GTPase